LKAKKENGQISISESSFEHLVNCLDNQKFINDRNADSTTCDAEKVQENNQAAIDDFNKQCRILFNCG